MQKGRATSYYQLRYGLFDKTASYQQPGCVTPVFLSLNYENSKDLILPCLYRTARWTGTPCTTTRCGRPCFRRKPRRPSSTPRPSSSSTLTNEPSRYKPSFVIIHTFQVVNTTTLDSTFWFKPSSVIMYTFQVVKAT